MTKTTKMSNNNRSTAPEPPLNGQSDPLTFKGRVDSRGRYKNAREFRDRRSTYCVWCIMFDTRYHGDMRPYGSICTHIIKSKHIYHRPRVIRMTISDIKK